MTNSTQWLQERADLLAQMTEWRERAERAEAECKRLRRKCADHVYMMVALENMLGPKGKQVSEMWKTKGVQRIHFDWDVKAMEMTGEQRAQAIMDFTMEATDE